VEKATGGRSSSLFGGHVPESFSVDAGKKAFVHTRGEETSMPRRSSAKRRHPREGHQRTRKKKKKRTPIVRSLPRVGKKQWGSSDRGRRVGYGTKRCCRKKRRTPYALTSEEPGKKESPSPPRRPAVGKKRKAALYFLREDRGKKALSSAMRAGGEGERAEIDEHQVFVRERVTDPFYLHGIGGKRGGRTPGWPPRRRKRST